MRPSHAYSFRLIAKIKQALKLAAGTLAVVQQMAQEMSEGLPSSVDQLHKMVGLIQVGCPSSYS